MKRNDQFDALTLNAASLKVNPNNVYKLINFDAALIFIMKTKQGDSICSLFYKMNVIAVK